MSICVTFYSACFACLKPVHRWLLFTFSISRCARFVVYCVASNIIRFSAMFEEYAGTDFLPLASHLMNTLYIARRGFISESAGSD
jgi:hypothetical protein